MDRFILPPKPQQKTLQIKSCYFRFSIEIAATVFNYFLTETILYVLVHAIAISYLFYPHKYFFYCA